MWNTKRSCHQVNIQCVRLQDLYGVDWQGPVNPYEDVEHVEVPSITVDLTSQQLTELQQIVHPLEECDDLGVSLYTAARTFVNACF